MRLNIQQQAHTIQLINLLITFYGIYYVYMTGDYWLLGLSYLIVFVYTCVGLQAGYHRLLTHKSYKTSKFMEYIMSSIGVMCIVGSPIAWVSAHRQHHRYPDTEKDPHSPHILGLGRSLLGVWKNVEIDAGCGAYDLAKDKFQRFLHKYYFRILFVYAGLLYLMDPIVGIFCFSFPATLLITGANAVGTLTHWSGYRSYDTRDKSYNNWLAWLISLGTEGWHNNHHAHPRSWTNWEKWWEVDLTSMFVWLIKKKDQ